MHCASRIDYIKYVVELIGIFSKAFFYSFAHETQQEMYYSVVTGWEYREVISDKIVELIYGKYDPFLV